ncbi:MAG: L-2-amino-thiazoline-4-carboxylic acid hydrolase [Candidatus Kariarchaeaceae archaeon]|jgi:hypothetical protein
MDEDGHISHLKRREIQAPIVSTLINRFIQEFGYDKTINLVKDAIKEDAVISGKELAEKYSGNSLMELSRIVKEVWAKDDAMNVNIILETENELSFDVTHCGYADLYGKLNIQKLGCIMSCIRDYYFLEGFNPLIKLIRTKTIMEGDEVCDFRYVVE